MVPLVYGHYPRLMRDLVKERLPAINDTEKTLLTGAFDFIGINYYTSRFAKHVDKPVEPPTYLTDSLAELVTRKNSYPLVLKYFSFSFKYLVELVYYKHTQTNTNIYAYTLHVLSNLV